MGPVTEPCGIPLIASDQEEYELFVTTHCFLPVRKAAIHFSNIPSGPYAFSFVNSLLWSTEWNAFLKSRYAISTESVNLLAAIFSSSTQLQPSVVLYKIKSVLFICKQTINCHIYIAYNILLIMDLKTLYTTEVRLMGQ